MCLWVPHEKCYVTHNTNVITETLSYIDNDTQPHKHYICSRNSKVL